MRRFSAFLGFLVLGCYGLRLMGSMVRPAVSAWLVLLLKEFFGCTLGPLGLRFRYGLGA